MCFVTVWCNFGIKPPCEWWVLRSSDRRGRYFSTNSQQMRRPRPRSACLKSVREMLPNTVLLSLHSLLWWFMFQISSQQPHTSCATASPSFRFKTLIFEFLMTSWFKGMRCDYNRMSFLFKRFVLRERVYNTYLVSLFLPDVLKHCRKFCWLCWNCVCCGPKLVCCCSSVVSVSFTCLTGAKLARLVALTVFLRWGLLFQYIQRTAVVMFIIYYVCWNIFPWGWNCIKLKLFRPILKLI